MKIGSIKVCRMSDVLLYNFLVYKYTKYNIHIQCGLGYKTLYEDDVEMNPDQELKPKLIIKEPSRILLSLSRGGADATVVREFDLQSKTFGSTALDDDKAFCLKEFKNRVSWKSRNVLLVGMQQIYVLFVYVYMLLFKPLIIK